MGTNSRKIILFDMDMTLIDSSIAKQYGKNYKEVQKHISEFSVYDGIREVIEQLSERYIIYVVSGNVGSIIKKVIQYFSLNIPSENIYGYRQGYPMENFARKNKVLQIALNSIMQKYSIDIADIIYFGDEVDDYKACELQGINFVGCIWGNSELKQLSNINTISLPIEIFDIIN